MKNIIVSLSSITTGVGFFMLVKWLDNKDKNDKEKLDLIMDKNKDNERKISEMREYVNNVQDLLSRELEKCGEVQSKISINIKEMTEKLDALGDKVDNLSLMEEKVCNSDTEDKCTDESDGESLYKDVVDRYHIDYYNRNLRGVNKNIVCD